MDCKRCGASESYYFHQGKCRRCIHFKIESLESSGFKGEVSLDLKYQLTPYQKKISGQLKNLVFEGKNVYLEAVCGAGKTEMCLELLEESLALGLRVCWAIPRRQVVLELSERLSEYFPGINVVPVCQGFTDLVLGDLIVCTTHQLYRYYRHFDLLILDEPDAFPFAGNTMLEFIMNASVRGPIVYLSATLDDIPKDFHKLNLSLRPSGHLLPEPKTIKSVLKLFQVLYKWRKESVLVFVPTRKMALHWSFILCCPYITSETEDKESLIERFRNKGGFLVTTSVLERGVTFKDVFVIVIHACHPVFNKSSLIQIAGRVGRGMHPKKGEVVFWVKSLSLELEDSLEEIKNHNRIAHSVLKAL